MKRQDAHQISARQTHALQISASLDKPEIEGKMKRMHRFSQDVVSLRFQMLGLGREVGLVPAGLAETTLRE